MKLDERLFRAGVHAASGVMWLHKGARAVAKRTRALLALIAALVIAFFLWLASLAEAEADCIRSDRGEWIPSNSGLSGHCKER